MVVEFRFYFIFIQLIFYATVVAKRELKMNILCSLYTSVTYSVIM